MVMTPERTSGRTPYRVLDITWVSDYPDEREYLTFDHDIEIEAVILSTDYDRHYHYYHSVLTKRDEGAVQKGPPDHLSYAKQMEISKHFDHFTALVVSNETERANILDFGRNVLSQREKMDLFCWITNVMDGRFGSMSNEFRQCVRDNLWFLFETIREIKVPRNMLEDLVKESKFYSKDAIDEVFGNYFSSE